MSSAPEDADASDIRSRTVEIRKFDIDSMHMDAVVALFGRRGSGKSTLLHTIMNHIGHRLDHAVAMSPTFDSVKMFREFMPLSAIHPAFDEEILMRLLEHATNEQFNDRPLMKVGVLLDDCMYDKKVLKGKAMRELHMNGRHLKLLFINIVQYLMDYPADIRGSIDYVFSLWEPSMNVRQKLYEYFLGGVFQSFEQFETVFRALTKDRGVFVLDNRCGGQSISDCVFHFRGVQNLPRFCIGNKDYWKLHYGNLEVEMSRRLRRRVPRPLPQNPGISLSVVQAAGNAAGVSDTGVSETGIPKRRAEAHMDDDTLTARNQGGKRRKTDNKPLQVITL